MIEYRDVTVSRILNPTSIDLGEYVINPYKGCEFSCLYCYVRSNKTISRETRVWGSYVDARMNAPEQLEKELMLKKPKCVLLGSTTECFQPVEKKYGITRKILEILNKHGVYYSILTRSPIAAEYVDLLKEGFCKKIYFTVNTMTDKLKDLLEPKSPSYELRFNAIIKLYEHKIPVVPYFSPVLPWISDFESAFKKLGDLKELEFEGLNFNVVNIADIMAGIFSVYSELQKKYELLLRDKKFYQETWEAVRREVVSCAIKYKKSYNVYIHKYGGYFENKYTR